MVASLVFLALEVLLGRGDRELSSPYHSGSLEVEAGVSGEFQRESTPSGVTSSVLRSTSTKREEKAFIL